MMKKNLCLHYLLRGGIIRTNGKKETALPSSVRAVSMQSPTNKERTLRIIWQIKCRDEETTPNLTVVR